MVFALLIAAFQAELIDRLGSEDIEVRDDASARLKKAGEAARPALLEALQSPDPEIAARAGGLLESLARAQRTTLIWSIENSDPEQVTGILRRLPLSDSPMEIVTDPRTRSVIVRATTAELELMSQVIAELDQPTTDRVYVVRLGGDAATIALRLQELLRVPAR